jgi:hypothetical protein
VPLTVPSTIFPVEERFVNVAREATPGTIPAAPYGTTFPVVNLEPEDKPIWLLDEGLRGGMGDFYGVYQGPMYAEVTVPTSPVFADMICHPLYNTLGDYTQSAPAATPNTTLTANAAAGATSLTVTSGTSFTVNMWILVYQTGATGPAELVQVLSSASTTITLQTATPLRFPHTSGATVTNTSVAAGTYQHIFTVLCSGFIGNGNYQNFAQPVTHTWTDRTQVPSFGGNPGFARQYADACFSKLQFTGNAEKLVTWDGSFSSYIGQIASTLPTASISGATPYPDFNALTYLATSGSLTEIYDIAEWQIGISRQLKVQFTNDGSQNPYVIGRGKAGVTGKLTFAPATDETALLYMLANTQPQLQIIASNGLATTNPLYEAMQFDMLFAAFETSKITSSDVLFGYDVGFKVPHVNSTRNSVTTTGWSGGFSAIKVTVSNAVPIF